MAKKVRNKKGLTIDLSGVETGQKTLPEGIYTVKVEAATAETSSSGNPYIKFVFQVIEGKHKGAKVFHNCSLQPQALFNLKALLLAIGYEIPQGAFDLDLEEVLDLECEVEVAHETYEGKKQVRIIEFIALDSDDEDQDEEEDEDEESEDEDEEDDEDESEDEDEEEEDEEDEEDLSELSLKELKALAKERGVKVTKGMTKEDIIELLSEEDEEDEEEDEEDEEDEIDYSAMSLKDLKAAAREAGIKVKKGMTKEDIIEALEDQE